MQRSTIVLHTFYSFFLSFFLYTHTPAVQGNTFDLSDFSVQFILHFCIFSNALCYSLSCHFICFQPFTFSWMACACLHCLLHLDFLTFFQIPSLDLSHSTFLCGFIKKYFQPHFVLQHSPHFLQGMHFLVISSPFLFIARAFLIISSPFPVISRPFLWSDT